VKPLDLLLALSVPTLWGLGFTLAKAGLDQFPPILLMALRFSLTALVLVWFVRPPWASMGRIFVIAVVSATIQYSLTFTGLKDLYASTAVLVVQLEVPFGALLAALFLNDRLGWRRAFGMVLAFVGVALIAGEPRVGQDLMPLFLVISGAFVWAIGQVMVKALGPFGGFTLIAWVAVFAAPQLFVSSWLVEEGQIEAIRNADWRGWAVVIYLGLVMTAIGYAIWYRLLALYQINQVMPFLLLLPVTSVSGSILILGERLSLTVAAGGAIVIAGVAIIIVQRLPLRLLAGGRRRAG
jgi:O-acetylserine/cysteine efflux transporter